MLAHGRFRPQLTWNVQVRFVLRISWESGLEAFSQLLQIGRCFLWPSILIQTPQRRPGCSPTGFHRPLVLLLIHYLRSARSVRSPVLGTGRDIKRHPAFPNWMIYFQVSTRPGIKLLVALRLLTTQGAQASAAGTHTHRGS